MRSTKAGLAVILGVVLSLATSHARSDDELAPPRMVRHIRHLVHQLSIRSAHALLAELPEEILRTKAPHQRARTGESDQWFKGPGVRLNLVAHPEIGQPARRLEVFEYDPVFKKWFRTDVEFPERGDLLSPVIFTEIAEPYEREDAFYPFDEEGNPRATPDGERHQRRDHGGKLVSPKPRSFLDG